IVFCAEILTRAVAEHGRSGLDFVGHIGGDDFVIIVDPACCKPIAQSIVDRFDDDVRRFYSQHDLHPRCIATPTPAFNTSPPPLKQVSPPPYRIPSTCPPPARPPNPPRDHLADRRAP